jgi:hypothetical protein
MKTIGWVFYEDQYADRPPTEFGPHNLVCACVADECGVDVHVHELRKNGLRPNPRKGANKLLAALESVEALASGGAHIFAVFDADRVREALHLAGNTTRAAVIADIVRRVAPSDPARLHVHLLEENTETLLEALGACDENARRLEEALAKNRNARDIALNRAALDQGRRAVRDCIRANVASFDALVKDVARVVATELLP